MFEFEKTVDNADGTVTLNIRISKELMNAFARIAIRDALEYAIRDEAVNELVATSQNMGLYDDKDEIECRSKNPAKVCANCTCWKNQND